MAADKAALTLGDISAVTANLTLPATGQRGSAVAWSSSNTAVIANNGTVTRPGATDDPANVDPDRDADARLRHRHQDVPGHGRCPAEGDQAEGRRRRRGASPSPTSTTSAATSPCRPPALHGADGHLGLRRPCDHRPTGVVHRPAHGRRRDGRSSPRPSRSARPPPPATFTATVRRAAGPRPYAGYAFSYFTGEARRREDLLRRQPGQQRAAAGTSSTAASRCSTSTLGTKGLRDPFLIRSPEGDKFYLIATDLVDRRRQRLGRVAAHRQQVHRGLGVDRPGQLVRAAARAGLARHRRQHLGARGVLGRRRSARTSSSGPRSSTPRPTPTTPATPTTGCCTPPPATSVTFSEPQDLAGPRRVAASTRPSSRTATPTTASPRTRAASPAARDIIQEQADYLLDADDVSDPAGTPATRPGRSWTPASARRPAPPAVEGPTVVQGQRRRHVRLEVLPVHRRVRRPRLHPARHRQPRRRRTGRCRRATRCPRSPRHGTVCPVTQAELDRLRNDPAAACRRNADGLVARLHARPDLRHDRHRRLRQRQRRHPERRRHLGRRTRCTFGGTNGHVKLPDNIMAGLDAITVSTEVWVDPAQADAVLPLGPRQHRLRRRRQRLPVHAPATTTTGPPSPPATGPPSRTRRTSATCRRGAWQTLTYTLARRHGARSTSTASRSARTRRSPSRPAPSAAASRRPTTSAGRSTPRDKYFKGRMRDFRIYNRALSAAEVGQLGGNTDRDHRGDARQPEGRRDHRQRAPARSCCRSSRAPISPPATRRSTSRTARHQPGLRRRATSPSR